MQSNTAAEPRLQGRMAALTLQMTVPAHDGNQPRCVGSTQDIIHTCDNAAGGGGRIGNYRLNDCSVAAKAASFVEEKAAGEWTGRETHVAAEKEDTSISAVIICLARENPHSLCCGLVITTSCMLLLLLLSR